MILKNLIFQLISALAAFKFTLCTRDKIRFPFIHPGTQKFCHNANIRLRFSWYPVKIHFPEDVISLDTPKHLKHQSFTPTYNYPDEKGDYFFIAFNNNISFKVISKTR